MTHLYCSKGHENPPGSRFCIQCGENLEQKVSQGIHPGLILDERYRVVRQLGQGGFGRTYLAQDLHRFEELCVLKEFAPQVQGTYALKKAEELFEREAGVLYKLQHPQIPKFRELFQVKQAGIGLLFLVQDYVDGQTYHALLEARKQQGLRFNEPEVMQLLLQLLPVLEYIHALGVVHRDISPDNLILRSKDGLPVLIDFGGVKQVAATVVYQLKASPPEGSVPAFPTRLGKAGYAPPEQMYEGMVAPHSDFYALAATALVLLTGKEPQQLIDQHTLEWNWRREISLSPNLARVLDKMLEPRPSDRFVNARAVLQALTVQPTPVVYPPTQPPAPRIEATQAVTPHTVAVTPQPTPSPSAAPEQSFGFLSKILLVFVSVVVAATVGWLGGNWWIQSKSPSKDVQTPVTDGLASPNSSPAQPTDESPQESNRKTALRQRRTNLGLDDTFYNNLVNEAFWSKFPDQRSKVLGTGADSAQLREDWDKIASDLLTQLEQLKLSASGRQQLGRYGNADLTDAKAQANKLRLSSRSLYDLADAKFFLQFPQERGKDFLNKPIGQVWEAVVIDRLSAVKTGEAFEPVVFEPGTVNKQLSSRLNPGEGKAFTASFAEGQTMNVKLATSKKALFSIYSPSGKTTLLEDSRERTWSGILPETGVYEFVVVSDASEPIDYQLDITVASAPSPQPTVEPTTSSPSPTPTPSP